MGHIHCIPCKTSLARKSTFAFVSPSPPLWIKNRSVFQVFQTLVYPFLLPCFSWGPIKTKRGVLCGFLLCLQSQSACRLVCLLLKCLVLVHYSTVCSALGSRGWPEIRTHWQVWNLDGVSDETSIYFWCSCTEACHQGKRNSCVTCNDWCFWLIKNKISRLC